MWHAFCLGLRTGTALASSLHATWFHVEQPWEGLRGIPSIPLDHGPRGLEQGPNSGYPLHHSTHSISPSGRSVHTVSLYTVYSLLCTLPHTLSRPGVVGVVGVSGRDPLHPILEYPPPTPGLMYSAVLSRGPLYARLSPGVGRSGVSPPGVVSAVSRGTKSRALSLPDL